MSQEQPKSIHHYRALRDHMGCELALINAASDVDNLTDQLGRRLDLLSVIRISQIAVGFLLGILVTWAMACASSIGHVKVEGWPVLTVYEHHVPHNVMRDKCAKYTSFGSYPEACAEFNLNEKRCDIYFSSDFPPAKWMVEHERQHCAGYQHVGDDSMAVFLANYKKAN